MPLEDDSTRSVRNRSESNAERDSRLRSAGAFRAETYGSPNGGARQILAADPDLRVFPRGDGSLAAFAGQVDPLGDGPSHGSNAVAAIRAEGHERVDLSNDRVRRVDGFRCVSRRGTGLLSRSAPVPHKTTGSDEDPRQSAENDVPRHSC